MTRKIVKRSTILGMRTYYPSNNSTNSYILHINRLLCKLNKDIISLLVLFGYKSHVGIPHNEHVDHLAKESTLSNQNSNFDICLSDCKIFYKNEIYNNWVKLYENYQLDNPMSQYARVVDHIPKTPWYKNINAPRKFITGPWTRRECPRVISCVI